MKANASATARPKLVGTFTLDAFRDLMKQVDEKNDHAVATQDENGAEVIFRFNRSLWKFEVRDGNSWRTV